MSARRPIQEVAADLGLRREDIDPYGHGIAKLDLAVLDRERPTPNGNRLVLVTSMTATPAGAGKTTTTIGLAQGLRRLGERVCVALREPSLGPCLGRKGGGTGAGRSELVPAHRINLHFTGDMHAVTSAHNLLAALIDNHLFRGNESGLDSRRIAWPRVLDMNDRSLRRIVVGLGGETEGVPREDGCEITAASEVMAALCLAEGIDDLRTRLERIIAGYTREGNPVTAHQLDAAGAMLVLLRDAVHPNLVQTCEGAPAIVHGGPFANIAHGCNSVIATRMACHLADWAITEAGFGFDLGGEKFFDIKCRSAGLDPAAVVMVATVRALKMHGGTSLKALEPADPGAVSRGLVNLAKHVENVQRFGYTPVVALNRFDADTDAEIAEVESFANEHALPFVVCDHYARGGEGAESLARAVIEQAEQKSEPFRPLYALSDPVVKKIEAVACGIYGAGSVHLTPKARKQVALIERLGYHELPVCIAKTQMSLSDDSSLRGRPEGFEVTVRDLQVNAGAGFLVVLIGDILRMPGLPARPLASGLDVHDGEIVGLL